MKKISLILFSCGILLLLFFFLYPKNEDGGGNDKPVDDNPKWVIVHGSKFDVNIPLYDTDSLFTGFFNNTNSDIKSKYYFAIPKEDELFFINDLYNEYRGPVIVNYSSNNEINNFEKYINTEYINDKKNNYNKRSVSKWSVDEKRIVINGKYLNEENNIYMEDLTLFYLEDDSRYSYVKYEIIDKSFSEVFIKKVIDNFKVEKGKASYTVCNENNKIYNCAIEINGLNKNVIFNVDANKYHQEERIAPNNYTSKFSFNETNIVMVTLLASNNIEGDFNNIGLFNGITSSKTTINSKIVDKYSFKGEEAYFADYIIKLSDNISIMLTISNSDDQIDVIAKDFINFKLEDIK